MWELESVGPRPSNGVIRYDGDCNLTCETAGTSGQQGTSHLFLHFSHTNTLLRDADREHRKEANRPSHLVRGCLLLLGAHIIFLIIGKHDQTNEATHTEGHLLAGEHCIAGAAKDRGR